MVYRQRLPSSPHGSLKIVNNWVVFDLLPLLQALGHHRLEQPTKLEYQRLFPAGSTVEPDVAGTYDLLVESSGHTYSAELDIR